MVKSSVLNTTVAPRSDSVYLTKNVEIAPLLATIHKTMLIVFKFFLKL